MESNLPVLSRASSAEESNGSAGEWCPGVVVVATWSHRGGSVDKEADSVVIEGRVRKLQRTSGTDTKAPFRGRRPSVREHKAPLGPRPYEKQR